MGTPLKFEHHITQIGMSFKSERHSNWNATQIVISLKFNIIKIKMSLNLECDSIWKVTQILMSLKFDYNSN